MVKMGKGFGTFILLLAVLSGCSLTSRSDRVYVGGEDQIDAGEYDAAVETFSDFIEKYGASELVPGARLGLVQAYLKKNEYRKSLQEVELFQNERNDFLYPDLLAFIKIYCRFKLGETERALDDTTDFFDKYPDSVFVGELNRIQARMYLENGQYDRLDEVVTRLEDLGDDYSMGLGYFYEAELKRRRGYPTAAIAAYRAGLQVLPKPLPEREEAIYQLAQVYKKLAMFFEFVSISEEYVKEYPQGKFITEVLYSLGKRLEEEDREEEAVPFYERLARLPYPSFYQVETLDWLVRYYVARNDRNNATIYAEILQRKYPDSDAAEEVRQWIKTK